MPHHITQRGNYGQNIFISDSDRKQYIHWLREYSGKYGLSVFAYCLMINHVHLIVMPDNEKSLSHVLRTLHTKYSQFMNSKAKIKGHLWQGRYFSSVLDEAYLIAAVRYVENNPVRAGLVSKPCEWKWSTARMHCGFDGHEEWLGDIFKLIDCTQNSWKELLGQSENTGDIDFIRKCTKVGRPIGGKDFIVRIEDQYKIRFPSLVRGRPRVL